MTQPTPPPEDPDSTGLVATPPGFGPPSHQQPTNDPLDPAVTTVTEEPPPLLEGVERTRRSLRDRLRQTAGGADVDPGHSTPPTPLIPRLGPSQVFTPDPEAFQGVIETGVGLLSLGVNRKLSPDTNAWMAEPGEAEAIAEPLARIAARHIKLTDKAAANDLSDGLEAGMATVGYIVSSAQRSAAAQRPNAHFQPAAEPKEERQ